MENRFGLKDFFLFLILGALIVVVVLGMVQYDRQWQILQQNNQQLSNLTSDVSRIRQMLANGVVQSQGAINRPTRLAGFERVYASQDQPDYAEGDDLVQIVLQPPNALTPLIGNDAYAQLMQFYIQDRLVDLDPVTYKWLPRLAESWTISNDLSTIDFVLRRGVTFSDGTPFNADDVIFTFDWLMNPDVQDPRDRSYLDSMDHYQKIDDYHVRFHFKKPYFMSFDYIAYNVPMMSKAFYSKYTPKEFNNSTGLVLGTGPYRLPDPTSWRPEPGKPIVLLRNERYWGPRPSFNKMIWKVIEDPTARMTTFENGDADLWGPGYFGPHPEQYLDMLSNPQLVARTQHFALNVAQTGYYFVGWNEKRGRGGPPSYFADERVRKAMTMLIDRDAIVRQLVKGLGVVATGTFSAVSDQADPSITPWPYDADAARKLLAQAGFVYRGDQVYGPDGKPFRFSLLYATGSEVAKRMVPMIKDDLAQAGIQVDPDPQEWATLLKRIDDRQFEVVTLGWGGGVPQDDPYQEFDSSQIADTGDNFIQYASKDLDEAIETARITTDYDQRTQLWHKVCQILHKEQPYTFLYAEKELTFMDARIKGAVPTREGMMYRAQEWYVPKALQKYSD